MRCSRSRAVRRRRSTCRRSGYAKSSLAVDSRTLRNSRPAVETRFLPERSNRHRLEAQGRSRRGSTGPDGLFFCLVQLGCCVGETPIARFLGPARGRALIGEAGDVHLEAAARIVAQLRAGETGASRARHDVVRSNSVTSVSEDSLPATDRLPLDAFERDRKLFASGLGLEVDADVERVDSA